VAGWTPTGEPRPNTAGIDTQGIQEDVARRIGELLGSNSTTDLVDAHVALLVQPEDQILTSDEADIQSLLRKRRSKAMVVRV